MGNTPSNDGEHWVTTLKRGVVGLQKTVRAFKTPIDPSEFILEYGKISFNTDTGIFKYNDKKIRLRQKDKIFKIIKLLIQARGEVVTYDVLVDSLGLPNKTAIDKKKSKTGLGSSIRDLRRRLGIGTVDSKENNPFIATGKGIKLAFFSK
jgi:DNA-binding response OmpR family regulator